MFNIQDYKKVICRTALRNFTGNSKIILHVDVFILSQELAKKLVFGSKVDIKVASCQTLACALDITVQLKLTTNGSKVKQKKD